jgi:hypothetical protein
MIFGGVINDRKKNDNEQGRITSRLAEELSLSFEEGGEWLNLYVEPPGGRPGAKLRTMKACGSISCSALPVDWKRTFP